MEWLAAVRREEKYSRVNAMKLEYQFGVMLVRIIWAFLIGAEDRHVEAVVITHVVAIVGKATIQGCALILVTGDHVLVLGVAQSRRFAIEKLKFYQRTNTFFAVKDPNALVIVPSRRKNAMRLVWPFGMHPKNHTIRFWDLVLQRGLAVVT